MIDRSEAEAMMTEERGLEMTGVSVGLLAMMGAMLPSMIEASLADAGLDGSLPDQVMTDIAKRFTSDPTVEALMEGQLHLLQHLETVREERYRPLTAGGELRAINGGRS